MITAAEKDPSRAAAQRLSQQREPDRKSTRVTCTDSHLCCHHPRCLSSLLHTVIRPGQHILLHFAFIPHETTALLQSRPPSLTLTKYPLTVNGQVYFDGLSYYLCVASSEMFLYGMLKCKEFQDSYV